jgi:hypothetical protein
MSTPEVKFDVNDLKNKIESIKLKITELKEKSTTNNDIEAYFFNNEEQLYQKYPYLIKKLIKNDDLEFLDKMISNLEMVESGEQTFASTELKLGKELADQYLPKKE